MKRLFYCCIVAALFFCQAATAQDTHWGVKAGLNTALLTSDDDNETEYRLGLHLGGLAHIHLTGKFALQPELMYSAQGGKRELAGQDAKTHLHYLNLPVLVQYMFQNGFRLQAGPQVGFMLKAQSQRGDVEVDVGDNFKAVDLSLPVGVSYLGKKGLGVDLRWAFGLSNINDVGNDRPILRNQVGQLGLFYLFNYGR